MKIIKQIITLESQHQIEFIDITEQVKKVLAKAGISDGLVTVYSPHTTASIVVNHNEPMLIQDMIRTLYRIAPIDERYSHDMFELTQAIQSDGRSNGHSHCKNMILGGSASIPVADKQMMIKELQSVFFVELDGARSRDYVVQVMGE